MIGWRRRERLAEEVVGRLSLGRGSHEKPLAWAQGADQTWLVGTALALHVVGPLVGDEARRIPWEQVESADWDLEDSRLRVVEIGEFGQPRPSYALVVEDPHELLQLLRERVTASIVLQRRVVLSQGRGLSVIGRRSPAGGPISWMHSYDAGVDPDDPSVRAAADHALMVARAEVGEPI